MSRRRRPPARPPARTAVLVVDARGSALHAVPPGWTTGLDALVDLSDAAEELDPLDARAVEIRGEIGALAGRWSALAVPVADDHLDVPDTYVLPAAALDLDALVDAIEGRRVA